MLPRKPKPPVRTPLPQNLNVRIQPDRFVVADLEVAVAAVAGEVVVLPVRGEDGGGGAGGGEVWEEGVVGFEEGGYDLEVGWGGWGVGVEEGG